MDPLAESKRVTSRLNALAELLTRAGATFWCDREKGHVLALLQDRVGQVGDFVERCRRALTLVHDALFPLNPLPQGLHNLLRHFRKVLRIHQFVRDQLIGGARVALAWVRVHHPRVNLQKIARGLSPTPNGEPW